MCIWILYIESNYRRTDGWLWEFLCAFARSIGSSVFAQNERNKSDVFNFGTGMMWIGLGDYKCNATWFGIDMRCIHSCCCCCCCCCRFFSIALLRDLMNNCVVVVCFFYLFLCLIGTTCTNTIAPVDSMRLFLSVKIERQQQIDEKKKKTNSKREKMHWQQWQRVHKL